MKMALLPALADRWTSHVTLFGVLLSSPRVRRTEGGREGPTKARDGRMEETEKPMVYIK